MGSSTTVIPKTVEVDGVTIDTNAEGKIEIKGGAVTNDLIEDNTIQNNKFAVNPQSMDGSWDLVHEGTNCDVTFSNATEVLVIKRNTGNTGIRVNNISSGYEWMITNESGTSKESGSSIGDIFRGQLHIVSSGGSLSWLYGGRDNSTFTDPSNIGGFLNSTVNGITRITATSSGANLLVYVKYS